MYSSSNLCNTIIILFRAWTARLYSATTTCTAFKHGNCQKWYGYVYLVIVVVILQAIKSKYLSQNGKFAKCIFMYCQQQDIQGGSDWFTITKDYARLLLSDDIFINELRYGMV